VIAPHVIIGRTNQICIYMVAAVVRILPQAPQTAPETIRIKAHIKRMCLCILIICHMVMRAGAFFAHEFSSAAMKNYYRLIEREFMVALHA
jgi:hypothetical protein